MLESQTIFTLLFKQSSEEPNCSLTFGWLPLIKCYRSDRDEGIKIKGRDKVLCREQARLPLLGSGMRRGF